MEDGHFSKDVIKEELACVRLQTSWPPSAALQGRVQKRREIHRDGWEATAADCSSWRRVIQTDVRGAEAKREQLWHNRRNDREQELPPYPCYQQRKYAPTAVTETATQGLDFTVTVDAAPIQ